MSEETTEVLRLILAELTIARAEQREGFQTVVSALQASGIKFEKLGTDIAGELRIVNNSIINTNIRLDGMDSKSDSIDNNVKRIADK